MPDYLNEFSSTLPKSEQDRINKMLEEASGPIDNSKISGPTMSATPQPDQTNSSIFNQNLIETYTDLISLHYQLNQLDNMIASNSKMNHSKLDLVKADMKKISRKIESLNLLADNTDGYNEAKREDFLNATNSQSINEGNIDYSASFKDRNGDSLNVATVDSSTGCLVMTPINGNRNRLYDANGPKQKAEIIEQVGQGFITKDPNFDLKYGLDADSSKYWAEVILADEPLKVPVDGITGGAICKFKIVFDVASPISEIKFKPYCEFPIELLAIKYSPNDSLDDLRNIITYDPSTPIYLSDNYQLIFSSVMCKTLVVTIRQTTAHKNSYLVSKDQINNKEMWSRIKQREADTTLTSWKREETGATINPSLTQDLIDKEDATWQEYLNGKNATSAPERILVDKYEYIYGLYSMEVNGNDYEMTNSYVSKTYEMKNNIQQIVLESKEFHPVITDKNAVLKKKVISNGNIIEGDEDLRRTSVEYYVTGVDKPGPEDWIPILPLGVDRVNQEILLVSAIDRSRAKLRFRCDITKEYSLYKNEIPLLYGRDWVWGPDEYGVSQSGNFRQYVNVITGKYSENDIYTIDYYPDSDHHSADFTVYAANPKTATEIFDGTDMNCCVKLSYYPYVDRKKLRDTAQSGSYSYNPVSVILNPVGTIPPEIYRINGRNGAIVDPIYSTINPNDPSKPRARCLNVTDYTGGTLPALTSYSLTDINKVPTFEYFHDTKKVYFSETFKHDGSEANYDVSNGNAKIQISYEYLSSGIRVKIIERRNYLYDTSLTPRVDWYSIKCKALE